MASDPNSPYMPSAHPGSYAAAPGPMTKRHSGLGIASFVISLICGLVMFGLVVAAGVLSAQPGGMDEESVAAIAIGLGIFAIGGTIIIGVTLGIAGLFQQDRSKLFCTLGIAFNVLIILLIAGLMIIGMTANV